MKPLLQSQTRPMGVLVPSAVITEGSRSVVYQVALADTLPVYALKRAPLIHWNVAAMTMQRSLLHPALLPLLDIWTDDAHGYALMPMCETNARQQPPSPTEAASWVHHLAQGLLHLHQLGWVHRDIKPDNVLLTAQGLPMLADFDHARPIGQQGEPSSPLYAAPQALLGQPASLADDVYALGMLFYEWLAGAHPYAQLPAKQALIAQFEHPLPPLPPAFAHHQPLIHGMTSKKADYRTTLDRVLSTLNL